MRASSSLRSAAPASPPAGASAPGEGVRSPVSLSRELCIYDVLVGLALGLGSTAVAACSVAAASALGGSARRQAREHLLKIRAQRSHPVKPRLVLEGLTRVADELLGTGFFVD